MAIITDGTPFANHGTLIAETQDNGAVFNWRNTMEIAWDGAVGPPLYGDAIVTAWTNFLKGIQRDDCSIVKVSLFPYVKGRQPLSAQGAIWEQVTAIPCKDWGAGTAHPPATSSLTAPVGEICVMFIKGKFLGGGGRIGRMFIRNAVPQEALKNTAGGPPALDPVTSGTTVAEWNTWATGNLGAFCTGAPLPKFILIHASKHGVPTGTHDIFDSQMSVPLFQRLTMHDLSAKNRK